MSNDLFHRICDRQDGLVTRAQAAAYGLTPDAVRHRLRPGGPWQRVLPGVYATFSGRLQHEQLLMAAVLYGGPTAMVTGAAACRAAGMRYVPADASGNGVRLLVASDVSRVSTGFVVVTATTRLPTPVRWTSQAVPMAPVARAALDTARDVGTEISRNLPRRNNGSPILTVPGARYVYNRALQAVRALVCESVQRALTLPDDLVAELEAGPRRGSGLARHALDGVVAGCRSAPECELRDLIATSVVLPMPQFNEPLPGHARVRPDACWPEARLIVEVDSTEWHRYGNAPEATEQRRALLASMGWLVIPVSPRRLRSTPAAVLSEIEAAYVAIRAA